MPFAVRPQFDWRLRTRSLALGPRTLIMGILNATPDSFSDGGQFLDPHAALTHALQMLDDGADILDLGGESTRPNSTPIPPARRAVARSARSARDPRRAPRRHPLHRHLSRRDRAPRHRSGAEIVNDVSGLLWDEQMAATCAALNCGVILMHTRGRPQQWRNLPALAPAEVTPLVLREFDERAEAALAAGIAHESIVLDPGFGFGKAFDENYPLLAHLDELHALNFPLLVGLSRKGFLRRASQQADQPNHDRPRSRSGAPHLDSEMWVSATTAANTAAILAGAHILRVHNVRPRPRGSRNRRPHPRRRRHHA